MKRFLLIGLLLAGTGHAGYAQVDDIYATGADQQKSRQKTANENDGASQSQQGSADDAYASDDYLSYNDPEDYIDDDDDYSYATRINRFNYSFYNMGYYSAFYNPYWYDPFWGPSWGMGMGMGWGWNRPYMGMGVGFGGPYWNSYWGWNTWYGYSGFNSCYNYPYYAGGWYGNCNNGYWNRYYGGVDGRVYNNRG